MRLPLLALELVLVGEVVWAGDAHDRLEGAGRSRVSTSWGVGDHVPTRVPRSVSTTTMSPSSGALPAGRTSSVLGRVAQLHSHYRGHRITSRISNSMASMASWGLTLYAMRRRASLTAPRARHRSRRGDDRADARNGVCRVRVDHEIVARPCDLPSIPQPALGHVEQLADALALARRQLALVPLLERLDPALAEELERSATSAA